jgi:hypothetical protein
LSGIEVLIILEQYYIQMKKITILLVATLISKICFSQSWTEMMQEPGRNFYEIQAAFNEYWKDKDITEKGKGYKPFKRWEYFVGQRVYPSGDLSLISTTWGNYQSFISQNISGNRTSSILSSNTWTAIGPMGALSGSVFGVPAKAGRDNFITFDPTNSNAYWCGSPSGGLWKTPNNGSSWSTTTDYLTVIGCSDLAVDPSNTNNLYLATGDGEGNGDTYSIGVLKSTDGGLTWNTTGLTFNVNQQRQMRRVIVNPLNPQILIAVGNFGVYRTTNGGTSWTLILGGNFYDAEFKSNNPNVVFVAGGSMYRSVNGGANFTQISTAGGIPTGSNRMNIAVTTADTNYVYVLASKSSNTGLLGVYRSTDGGVTFTTMCTTPDILSNPCNANTTGGQGWYDLSCAVSPLNRDEVVVGGVNVWKSTNGGVSFIDIGCWNSTTSNPPFVHADQHELEYTPTGTLYVTNDGGVSQYTGTSWIDRTSPRNISQIYKIGLSTLTPSLWITGHQDNGTNIYNGTTYAASYGGDGMDCFIDRTNDNNMFASLYNGGFRRSANGGTTWSSAINGLSGGAAWVSPWKQDPVAPTTLYAGYSEMFVSTDLGGSWTQLANTGGSGYVVEFAIAPTNNQVIYVIHGTSLRKTTDGGATWTNITGNLPVGNGAPTVITVHPADANTAWLTLSGYSAGNKVFQTTDGGATWINISYNLPNLPANCSVYQPGTNGRIYVGMDVGVYTKDNSSTTWTLYNSALPNVPIHDLGISPAAPTLLRAATYGRGVYQVGVIQASTTPVSAVGVSGAVCAGTGKNFRDNSSQDPTSWNWSVSPSAGVILNSSNTENPYITFSNGGTYTVSLTSSNGFGTGSTATQTVNVFASPVLTLTSNSSTNVCVNDSIVLSASGASTYTWLPNTKTGATLSFTATLSTPSAYTVNARDINGCTATQTLSLLVSDCTGLENRKMENELFTVFPIPASNRVTIKNRAESTTDVQLELEDANGKTVLKQTAHFKKDKSELPLNISSIANGIYILKLKTEKGSTYFMKVVKE